MAKHLSITTGDPLDTTTTFTAYIFLRAISFDAIDQRATINLFIYRAVAANEPGGSLVGQPIIIEAGDAVVTDDNGNLIQALYTNWDDAEGNFSFNNAYADLQNYSVYWPSNGEALDLSTATTLP